MNEQQLRGYIRRIFEGDSEPEDSQPKPESPKTSDNPAPKKKKKKAKSDTAAGEIGVAVGRGGWSKEVRDAGALAEEAPDELMSNLGIGKSASGFKGIKSIIDQALSNSDVMRKSYANSSLTKAGDKNGLIIKMGELDSRNGAKYLHHTLIGALNSEKLTLDVPVQIQRLDNQSIVIYVSPKRNTWVSPEAPPTEKKDKKSS